MGGFLRWGCILEKSHVVGINSNTAAPKIVFHSGWPNSFDNFDYLGNASPCSLVAEDVDAGSRDDREAVHRNVVRHVGPE